MKKLKLALAGAVYFGLILGTFLAMPPMASAALTESQIQAILSLLQSFGTDQAIVNNVNSSLRGLPTTGGGGGTAVCPNFTYNLYLGLDDSETGGQVSELQKFLAQDSSVFPEGTITGFYGPLTEQAVKRWQAKNGVVYSGSPDTTGYGVVGSRTREKIRAVCVGGGGGSGSIIPIGTPSLTVISPNGGETWRVGSTQTIKWTSSNLGSSLVNISFFGAGKNWIATNIPNSGSYSWTIPNDMLPGSYVIRVDAGDKVAAQDQSDSTFSIVSATQPSVTVISPNGGESWQVDSTQTIRWSAPSSASYVSISMIGYNPPCTTQPCPLYAVQSFTLGKVLASGGSFNWTVGKDVNGYSIPSGQYLMQITDTTTNISDQSDKPFSIVAATQPSITVLSPNGGESLRVGDTKRITWTSSGVSAVKIYVYDSSISGSGSTNYVTPNNISVSASQGYFDWTIGPFGTVNGPPGSGGSNYRIRIDDAAGVVQSDHSDAPFSIAAATQPSITVVSPNGGESWTKGSSQTIRYSAPSSPALTYGDVTLTNWSTPCDSKIQLCPLMPSVLYTLARHITITGGGSLSWRVGFDINGNEIPNGQYVARITDSSTGVSDQSDAPFSIVSSQTSAASSQSANVLEAAKPVWWPLGF